LEATLAVFFRMLPNNAPQQTFGSFLPSLPLKLALLSDRSWHQLALPGLAARPLWMTVNGRKADQQLRSPVWRQTTRSGRKPIRRATAESARGDYRFYLKAGKIKIKLRLRLCPVSIAMKGY